MGVWGGKKNKVRQSWQISKQFATPSLIWAANCCFYIHHWGITSLRGSHALFMILALILDQRGKKYLNENHKSSTLWILFSCKQGQWFSCNTFNEFSWYICTRAEVQSIIFVDFTVLVFWLYTNHKSTRHVWNSAILEYISAAGDVFPFPHFSPNSLSCC